MRLAVSHEARVRATKGSCSSQLPPGGKPPSSSPGATARTLCLRDGALLPAASVCAKWPFAPYRVVEQPRRFLGPRSYETSSACVVHDRQPLARFLTSPCRKSFHPCRPMKFRFFFSYSFRFLLHRFLESLTSLSYFATLCCNRLV